MKNIFLLAGVILTASGIGMQAAGILRFDGMGTPTGRTLINSGYFPLAAGILFNISALIINPRTNNTNVSN